MAGSTSSREANSALSHLGVNPRFWEVLHLFLLNPCNSLNYSRRSPSYQLKVQTYKDGMCIWFQRGTRTCAIDCHEWIAACLFLCLPITDDPSVFPPGSDPCLPTSHSPCMPVIELWYFSSFCTVGLKMFSFCVCFLCMNCAESIRNLLLYSTV